MKIAIITDDGKTISQHFANETHDHAHEPGQQHGFDSASQSRHGQMAEAIADCEILICRGMGTGAYESMKVRGIRPIVTDIEGIDEAALDCFAGQLVDHVEKLH